MVRSTSRSGLVSQRLIIITILLIYVVHQSYSITCDYDSLDRDYDSSRIIDQNEMQSRILRILLNTMNRVVSEHQDSQVQKEKDELELYKEPRLLKISGEAKSSYQGEEVAHTPMYTDIDDDATSRDEGSDKIRWNTLRGMWGKRSVPDYIDQT